MYIKIRTEINPPSDDFCAEPRETACNYCEHDDYEHSYVCTVKPNKKKRLFEDYGKIIRPEWCKKAAIKDKDKSKPKKESQEFIGQPEDEYDYENDENGEAEAYLYDLGSRD